MHNNSCQIIPVCPRIVSLQSNSQPGNKISACRYLRDGKTSHPRHRDRVTSSLNCTSSKMSSLRGIGISSNFLSRFLFTTHTCITRTANFMSLLAFPRCRMPALYILESLAIFCRVDTSIIQETQKFNKMNLYPIVIW